MFINPAFAQATASAATGSSMSGMIVQLVLIFAIFYILLIRPQQKRMKEHEAKLNAIKKGDVINFILDKAGLISKVSSPIVRLSDTFTKSNSGTGNEYYARRYMPWHANVRMSRHKLS